MEKTILEYYDELKPEHRELAIANYDFRSIASAPNLAAAVGVGFDWGTSKEGSQFWSDIQSQLLAETYFTEEPAEIDTAEDILEEALRITGGDRMEDYGPPDEDFGRVAIMWEQLFKPRIIDGVLKLKPQDIASAMIVIKLSRQAHNGKRDNWVDLAGYARCGNLCQEQENK